MEKSTTAPQHLVSRVVQSLHINHMQMSIIEVFICRCLHMNTSMILICIWLICRLCTALHTKCCGAVLVWLPRVLNSLCPTLPRLMLIDAVFLYLTEARYPSGSSDTLKRAIRRKAAVCVARDGVLYVQKKKKDNSVSVQGLIIRSRTRIGINIIIVWTLDI